LDSTANGPRVLVRDLNTGSEVYLDLLELESLTRHRPDFAALVRPD
jgi:hypothetical protein